MVSFLAFPSSPNTSAGMWQDILLLRGSQRSAPSSDHPQRGQPAQQVAASHATQPSGPLPPSWHLEPLPIYCPPLLCSSAWSSMHLHCLLCCAKSLQLCPTLCNPVDYSLPVSSVHGILQARILKRVAIPSSRGSSQPRDRNWVSCISFTGRWILYH